MGETEQIVAETIQSIGCVWIVAATAGTLIICALFRNTSHERLIHISQEVSILLSHIIILVHRDPKFSDYNWTICRLCAFGLHYFQTVTVAAFLLEAIQFYAISTSVELSGGFFSRRASAVLTWGLPLILSGFTAPFIYYDYVSWFSCWINLDETASKVVFAPLFVGIAVTAIVWEAAGSFRGQVLAGDRRQMMTALLNRQGLPLVCSLWVACHASGSMAIHYQRVGIYGLVFVLNAVFGTAIFAAHALSDQEMYSGIRDSLNDAAHKDAVVIAVISSTGEYFSSGTDLANNRTPDAGANDRLQSFVSAFIQFPKPLIALVQGPTVGIMLTSLALCDVVYASDSATFHTPFAALGLSPEATSSLMLPQILGPSKACDMLMFGRRLRAAEAGGLVSRIFPKDRFGEETALLLAAHARLPKECLRDAKSLVRGPGVRERLEAVNAAECELIARRHGSPEARAAVEAFFRRKAKL